MEQPRRKRGRPRVPVTEELIEARRLSKQRRNCQQTHPFAFEGNDLPDPSHSAAAQSHMMPDARLGSALESPWQRTNIDWKKGEFAADNTILDIGLQDQSCGCRGLLYYITNFKIVPAHGQYNPIDTDKTIIFGKGTTIEDCLHGSSVPHFKFNLSTWPDIMSNLHSKKHLTDIGGVLMDAGDVVYDRNNVTKVNLTLLDSSLSQINVHLWGKMATLFRMELQMSRNKNVVLIVTGLLVKPDKDKIILSSTPATDLFFNLNCRQLQHLPQHITDTYGDFISSVPNRPRYPYKMLPEADTTPLNSTIRELLHPRDSTPQKLRCNAIILDLLLEDNLHHASCIRCKELVNPEGNKY